MTISTLPPHRLRTEYLTNPIGIDVARPRFSWELRDARPGARQTAYRIVFASPEGTALHDTGRVTSEESTQVEVPGLTLSPGQRVVWRVTVWDADGKEGEASAPAFFESGLMGGDFGAKWIGSRDVGGPRTSSPPPYLRKTFTLPAGVKSARLCVTALGLYEARINGQRVGRDELTPGWSDYRKTVYYQTYDATPLLRPGENCLGAILGDGWYCGCVEWRGRQFYGDRPMLLARLVVTLADGKVVTVVSDGSWKAGHGETLEADLLQGEAIDLRRTQHGWDAPGFDDTLWPRATEYAPAHGKLVGQAHEPVRVTQVLRPVAMAERSGWPPGRYNHDFGQNLVGKIRLKVKATPGATIRLRYAEVLKEGANPKSADALKGDLYTENLRTARCTDYFTVGATGEGVFETRFTFHGFRYAEVAPSPGNIESHEIEALVMHSDYESTGEFECSDPLVNRLQENLRWGWRGNSLDVPTDCPQRDERLGWTGDAQVFVRTATFNFDTAAFWGKWIQDVADAQSDNGGVPMTCPSTDLSVNDGGPAWADAFIICPWTLYHVYGDKRVLARHYEALSRWVDFLDRTQRDGVRGINGAGSCDGFGDWLSIDADTPKDLIGSAFYAYAHRLQAEIAAVLGREDDSDRHGAEYAELSAKFRSRYLTPGGEIAAKTQTAAVLALRFGLLEPGQRKAVAAELVADIRRRGDKLSCGFVGSPYLPHVLTEAGHLDVAYALLQQKGWPSWLYAVTQGATTIWERWDGWTHDKGFQDAGMNSFNHYAYGAVGAWLYQCVAGLDSAAPGYRRLRFAPRPPRDPAVLSHAKAQLRTPYGWAESGWRIEGGRLHVRVVVPPNSSGTLVMPSGATREVAAGTHEASEVWT